MGHDIIVIGASAGGFPVLLELVAGLPRDLAASVFIVVHTPPAQESPLPELLARRGVLPVRHALDGEAIERGHIYVAPPDNHLLLRPDTMAVVRGPKENGHRPSVDALFRSASWAYGSRVIGVVLSGYLDCGCAGMMSIKARGGLSVVQDPATAFAQEMPRSVIDHVEVDYVVRPAELASLLVDLVAKPETPAPAPDDKSLGALEGRMLGERAELVCPLCSGALTETQRGAFEHFRCHIGHAFSLESLVQEQSDAMERALWAAVRSLEESASLSRRVSQRESGQLRTNFQEKAHTQMVQADLIREVLLHGRMLSEAERV